jgi:serine protease Do
MREADEMMTVINVGIEELPPPERNVRVAWVPVATQVLTTELAKQLGQEGKNGVRVTRVYEDGTTSGTFGLKVGDLIVAIDGTPLESSDPDDTEAFPTLIRQHKIGGTVALGVVRDGQAIELKGTLPGRPPQPREMQRYRDFDFDFTVRNIAYIDRMQKRWEDNPEGVLVDAVEEGGWTALARLGAGDLLMAIDNQPVHEVGDVKKILTEAKKQKKASLIFKVRRGIHTQFLEVEPIWKSE